MKLNIFNEYATQCADLFGISEELLFTKSKRRDIVDARYLLYYMCSEFYHAQNLFRCYKKEMFENFVRVCRENKENLQK